MTCVFLQIKESFGSAPQIFIRSLWYGRHCVRHSRHGGERDPHLARESALCSGGDEGTLTQLDIWGLPSVYWGREISLASVSSSRAFRLHLCPSSITSKLSGKEMCRVCLNDRGRIRLCGVGSLNHLGALLRKKIWQNYKYLLKMNIYLEWKKNQKRIIRDLGSFLLWSVGI